MNADPFKGRQNTRPEPSVPAEGWSGGAGGTAIVAELKANHLGDRERLERMIRAAHLAGADYIKLQKREVKSFYPETVLKSPYPSPFGETFEDFRNQVELAADDFSFVDALCAELGIGWYVSVLDRPSFEFIQQFSPRIVKLPSTISHHREFLTHVADSFAGMVVISTGMTDEDHERWILKTFVKCERLCLLQCTSAYPTRPEDCGIGVVRHYADLARDDPRIVPGYSSHDHGWKASALAVAAGARMVEKHVTLGPIDHIETDAVAVDLAGSAFADYVRELREAELMIGDGIKRIRASEHHKYPASR